MLYTLHVPKTLNKKFKKKRSGVPQEKRLSFVCVSLSLSLDKKATTSLVQKPKNNNNSTPRRRRHERRDE